MSQPKHTNPPKRSRQARAPYNFVPLPDQAIELPKPQTRSPHHDEHGLPDQDRYHATRYTGRLECSLRTLSPLYTRCAVDPAFFVKWVEHIESLYTDPDDQKKYAQFFNHGQMEQPIIPGSSLRGMVRSLLEIIAHGHMRWVGANPTFTFRAVAAARQDPLRQPYESVLGRFGNNVRAGYLERKGGNWFIQPALAPEEMGWSGRDKAYLKVKERQIPGNVIKGLQRFNSVDYKPSWHPVNFNIDNQRNNTWVTQIADYGAGYRHVGVLVCSGNMLKTAQTDRESPRRNHALVLPPNRHKQRVPIDKKAVDDYLAGLTSFQREELADWGGKEWGCLKDGAPVFYVSEQDKEGNEVVRYFGHSPNFRIPARLPGSTRAATPLNFVPQNLRDGQSPDLAEAIFGWVKGAEDSLPGQRAGRVFFTDAHWVRAENGLWLDTQPIALRTLSGPKPTTFQHYLVQDDQQKHDSDDLASLAHYGTSPDETVIRGYKLYWSKGKNPPIRASNEELKHPKQLTQVRPVKDNVLFQFSVHFENLSDVELGALLWVLKLPGADDKVYCHRLGMGKPLGMGAVAIHSQLFVDDRKARYTALFRDQDWQHATQERGEDAFVAKFERFILDRTTPQLESLTEVERIQTLLTLLEWREGDAKWLDLTRYMEIERGLDKANEYKERPVLPTPQEVIRIWRGESTPARQAFTPRPARPTETAAQPRTPIDHPSPVDDQARSAEYTGVVASFGHGPKQSYGFIDYRADNGDERRIFVHRNQLAKGVRALVTGQRVRFTIGKGPNGPQAENVRVQQ